VSLPPKPYETPASPSRNVDNFEQPLAKSPSTPAQSMPVEQTEAEPLPPVRMSSTPSRPQRSLDDLRGLRSMGRRHEAPHSGLEEENSLDDEEIDVPPFMKKYT